MESRFKAQILAQQDAYQALEKKGLIQEHLENSGDAFELGARVALGAWEARKGRPRKERKGAVNSISLSIDECLEFELGYRIAAVELACILRAMRKGGPPDLSELDAIVEAERQKVLE